MGFVSGIFILICIVAIVAVTVFVAYKFKEMNTDYDNRIKTLSTAVNVGMSNAAQYDMRQQNQLNIINSDIQSVNNNVASVGTSNVMLNNRINYVNQVMLASNAVINERLHLLSTSNSTLDSKAFALSNALYRDISLQTASNTQFLTGIQTANTFTATTSNNLYRQFQTQTSTNTGFTNSINAMNQRFTLITASNTRFDNTFTHLLNKKPSPSNVFTRGLYTTNGIFIGEKENGFIDMDTNGSTRIGFKTASGSSTISINKDATNVSGNLNVVNGINSGKPINVQKMGPLGTIIENDNNGIKVGLSGSNNTARLYTNGTNNIGLGYINSSGTGYDDVLRINKSGATTSTNITGNMNVNGTITNKGSTSSSDVNILNRSALHLGMNEPNKEVNAGKIAYALWSGDSLDVVGAGPTWTNRNVRIWDRMTINTDQSSMSANTKLKVGGDMLVNGNINTTGKLCFDNGTTCIDGNMIKKLLSTGVTGPSSTQNRLQTRLIRRMFGVNRTDLTNMPNMNNAFNNLKVSQLEHVSSFTPPSNFDFFALEFTGWIVVPTSGTYTFGVVSDDASDMSIYNNSTWLVLTHAYGYKGVESTPPNPGYINLKAGELYPVRIRFYEHGGGQNLRLLWQTPQNTSSFVDVPFSVFSCDGTTPITTDTIRNNFPDPRTS